MSCVRSCGVAPVTFFRRKTAGIKQRRVRPSCGEQNRAGPPLFSIGRYGQLVITTISNSVSSHDVFVSAVAVEPVQLVVQGGGGVLPGPLVSPPSAKDGTESKHTKAMAGSRRLITIFSFAIG